MADCTRFLKWLDFAAPGFTYQTFDDNEERKKALDEENAKRKKAGKTVLRDPRVCVRNGPAEDHWYELVKLNADGAGIFVTINATDLKGRKTANIIRVRALFVDTDGAPLEPIPKTFPKPHLIVESSPGRWHVLLARPPC